MRYYLRVLFLLSAVLIFSLSSDAAGRKSQPEDTSGVSCRGIMESFSSVYDGIDSRLGFYSSQGYTHYFYLPSDDRYCNAWGWKFLYNDSDRAMLKSLKKKCEAHGLTFVWSVNPGSGYGWDKRDYDFLYNKLLMMYYNGIRAFAVNLSCGGTKAEAVRDSLVAAFGVIKKEKPEIYLLDVLPSVSFPSVGEAAETIMSGYHLDEGFLHEVKTADAMICNVRERNELSKIAVTAVAQCASDPAGYDADAAMEKGVGALSPEFKSSFMTFLHHTGGVRESEEVVTFSLSEWSAEKAGNLADEFRKISDVPSQMEKHGSPVLMDSLRPWMVEFGKLGARGLRTIGCLEHYVKGDLGAFWLAYLENQMSEEDEEAYMKHKVGEKKLYPFIVNMMRELTEGFTSMLTGDRHLRNLASTLFATPNPALDSDFTTSMPSGGHLELPIPAQANACRLLTGALPEGETVFFRQLGTDGTLIAEFQVRSPYSEYDLKEGAVMVDVVGNVDIYESIFVYL